jgi:hypothetical protein
VIGAAVAVVLVTGGADEAKAQTVRFQQPTDNGPDPFTSHADVRREKRVDVGSGPFGGTGSDLVCDRELLIRSLRARPDRLREWARVLGVEPTGAAVARYIRKLRPVTLTRDTRVTNHSFVDGRAVAFQAILQAGTAVLVDKDGVPVARCRCGNPLLEPTFIKVAECLGCPPHYRPPRPCRYYDYNDQDYLRFDDQDYERAYDPRDYRGACYLPYPDPPSVRRRRRAPPPPAAEPARNPSASFSPPSGRVGQAFTLLVSGFAPNRTLPFTLTRPDGVVERYTVTTGSDGSGRHSFAPTGSDNVLGTYTAVITDPATGDRATASARLLPAETQPPATETSPQGLNCEVPRSQAEFERCHPPQEGPGAGATP